MTDIKKANPQASPKLFQLDNNSVAAQRRRLLSRLEFGPVDTITARRELNILHPAGRIDELRSQGFNIVTHRVSLTDDQGFKHHGVALYVLHPNREVA